MSELITEIEMREKLRAAITAIGSQKTWALSHGFTEPFVSMCLSGQKLVSKRLAAELGYHPVVAYAQTIGSIRPVPADLPARCAKLVGDVDFDLGERLADD